MTFRDEYNHKNDDETYNEEYRRRIIKLLEIPTYDNMTRVMYYDVLMKLSHQVVKHQFLKPRLPKIMRSLKVTKQLGGNVLHDDALAAVSYKNAARKDPYDTGLIDLF